MFGCLKKFILLIVIILAFIGFCTIGGLTFVKNFTHNSSDKVGKTVERKADEVADFSKLNEEFEVVSAAKLPKIGNYVYVEHKVSAQKFFLIKQPQKDNMLVKKDFSTGESDKKINRFLKNYKFLPSENFEITGKDSLFALGQTIPYSKFKSDIANLPIKGVQGIIGVFEKNGENVIIIAINNNDKYSQLITNSFLSEIK